MFRPPKRTAVDGDVERSADSTAPYSGRPPSHAPAIGERTPQSPAARLRLRRLRAVFDGPLLGAYRCTGCSLPAASSPTRLNIRPHLCRPAK